MKNHSILTNKEQKVYEFIDRYSKNYGRCPLLIEIAKGIGIKSKGVAHRYVKALEEAGKLSKISNKHRGILLKEKKPLFLKSLGKIAAGGPIEAITDQQKIELEYLFTNKRSYALKVKGDSMIDALIANDDIVIMKSEVNASNGEMIAAWLPNNEETTLKRFYFTDNKVELRPENSEYKSLFLDPKDVIIKGKVVGVIRKV